MIVRETSGIEMQRSSRETRWFLHMVSSTFATSSLQVDGPPFRFSLWISERPDANSWHHFQMLISMHDSPYTSINWWWISIGVSPFAFKNRIIVRTLHFAIVLSGSSITKGCQAKTKHPISVCAHLDGVGEWGKQHMHVEIQIFRNYCMWFNCNAPIWIFVLLINKMPRYK